MNSNEKPCFYCPRPATSILQAVWWRGEPLIAMPVCDRCRHQATQPYRSPLKPPPPYNPWCALLGHDFPRKRTETRDAQVIGATTLVCHIQTCKRCGLERKVGTTLRRKE